MVECLLYGVFLVLFVLSVYFLRTRNRTSSFLHLLLMSSVFLFNTVHIILSVVHVHQFCANAFVRVWEILDYLVNEVYIGWSDDILNGSVADNIVILSFQILFLFSSVLADGIIVYRVYLIWEGKKGVILIPALLFISTIATTIVQIFRPVAYYAFLSVTLATNIVSTGLTAGWIWHLNRTEMHLLGPAVKRTYDTTALILLTSGGLYSISIAAVLVAKAAKSVCLPLTIACMYQMVAIAPSLIFVRVGLETSINATGDQINCPPPSFLQFGTSSRDDRSIRRSSSILRML